MNRLQELSGSLSEFADLFDEEAANILDPAPDATADMESFDSGNNPFPGDLAIKVKLNQALEDEEDPNSKVKLVPIELANGTWMKVWAFVPQLAKMMKAAYLKNKRVVPYGEKTSSGPLKPLEGVDEGGGVLGVTTALINELKEIAQLVEPMDLAYGSILTPLGVSVSHLNQFIACNDDATETTKKKIFYDITTDADSTLVANFITGGLGDNRRRLRVNGVLLIDYKGDIHFITDMDEIDALRGSQAAGFIVGISLDAEEVPKNEEMLVLPINDRPLLKGNDDEVIEQTSVSVLLREKIPRVITQFWPEMYERKLEGDQVWMTGVEMVSPTGTRFVHNGDARWVQSEWFDKGDDLILVVSTMTTAESVFDSNSGFHQALFGMIDAGVIDEDRTTSLDGERPKQMKNLRKDVPLCARAYGNTKEQGEKLRHTESIDDDVQIVLHDMDELLDLERKDRLGEDLDDSERLTLDEFRTNLALAVSEVMKPTADAIDSAIEQGIDHMINGHLKMIVEENAGTDEQIALDGGANAHTRFFGRPDQKDAISALVSGVRAGHRALHGKWFGPHIEIRVNGEGEKHYRKHWEDRLQQIIIERRLAILAKYGGGARGTTSYRTPPHLWSLAPDDAYTKNGFVVSNEVPLEKHQVQAQAAK
jgi:hypothetical protein